MINEQNFEESVGRNAKKLNVDELKRRIENCQGLTSDLKPSSKELVLDSIFGGGAYDFYKMDRIACQVYSSELKRK